MRSGAISSLLACRLKPRGKHHSPHLVLRTLASGLLVLPMKRPASAPTPQTKRVAPTPQTRPGAQTPLTVPALASRRALDQASSRASGHGGAEEASGPDDAEMKKQDQLYVGFMCKFTDEAALLQATTALQARQQSRQSTAVDWGSLVTTKYSFALRWVAPVKWRAGHMWMRRSLEGMGLKYSTVGLPSWPPSADGSQDTVVQPGGAASSGAASSGAASSGAASRKAASRQPVPPKTEPVRNLPLPSWPRHPSLKLMISSVSSSVPGPVSAGEWYNSLGDELGRGSFGVVRKASSHGQIFAVKVMDAKNRLSAYQEFSACAYVLSSCFQLSGGGPLKQKSPPPLTRFNPTHPPRASAPFIHPPTFHAPAHFPHTRLSWPAPGFSACGRG